MPTRTRIVSDETINKEYLFIGAAIATTADKSEIYKKHRLVFRERAKLQDNMLKARLFLINTPIVLPFLFPLYVFQPMPSYFFCVSFLIYHSLLTWLLWESYITYNLNRNEFSLPNDPFASSVTNKHMLISFVLGLLSIAIWGTVHCLTKIQQANISERLNNFVMCAAAAFGALHIFSQYLCIILCMPFGLEDLPEYDKNSPPKYTLAPPN